MKITNLTEEQILQITNDITEDICTADAEMLQEVVRYWTIVAQENHNKFMALCDKIVITILNAQRPPIEP